MGGFTLIEIMIVLAIVGLMSVAATQGFRSLRKADLREASTHMSGAIRYLFDRASTTGKIQSGLSCRKPANAESASNSPSVCSQRRAS